VPPTIDIHFHMLAVNDRAGCNLSRHARFDLPAGWIAGMLLGTLDEELIELIHPSGKVKVTSEGIRQRLFRELTGAKEIRGAVLLALDPIFDEGGTQLAADICVSNDFVADAIEQHGHETGKQLYLGASVHPNRSDALEQLTRLKQQRAVLVKWVPSSQRIDPASPRHDEYYRKLVALKLPLLCHSDPESAIPDRPRDETLNEPKRLRRALELGVTVILAHCGVHYVPKLLRPKEEPEYAADVAALLMEAEIEGWKLYADVSACLITPYRAEHVGSLLNRFPAERFVYGSDFPIFTHDLSLGHFGHPIDGPLVAKAARTTNLLDKDVLSKRSVGMPPTIFGNTATVLGLV
jgi:uncharacterized protein